MGHADDPLDSDEALAVTASCGCRECGLVHMVLGMGITIDMEAYQDENAVKVPVKEQQSQSESRLSESVVSQLRLLGGILVFQNRSPERLTGCQARRASCLSRCVGGQARWGGLLQEPKAGSKRGLWETDITNFLQDLHRACGSSISEAPAGRKRFTTRGNGANRNGANGGDSKFANDTTFGTSTSRFYCKDKFQYIRDYRVEEVVRMPSLASLLGNEAFKNSVLSIQDLPELHCWLLEEEHPVSAKRRRVEAIPREHPVVTNWDSLPLDLQDNVFDRLEFKDLFRCKTLSKGCKKRIESDAFSQWRGATSSREGLFTAISYYIKNNAWQCTGYDLHSHTWRSLPTFSYLPAPDAELFKEYSVCGHGSLMCAQVSKLPRKGELVVFNPLSGKKRALPPLLYPRNPVLVHMSVNSAAESYTVVVAGSSTASDEHLSKKVEVFDSNTSKWREACDLPGPVFGLNEHQAGVCVNGILYFIAFLEGNCRRGVIAFDVENGKWLENMACAIPFSLYSNTLQLVECNAKVYLFSEQERGGSVEHCIDVYESSHLNTSAGACHWRNVVRVKKCSGRGLQVYPEHTCVSFGDGKLCVFNTLSRDGVVYDMRDGKQVEVLPPPPPNQKGDNFFSLNPASFTLQPSFDSDPIPPAVDAI